MTNDKFTCDNCNETFIKLNTDEQARQEYKKSPWNIPKDSFGVVCDDCLILFKAWFETLTAEQHIAIQANINE